VSPDDVLFVRHPPIEGSGGYGVSIPEHRVADQSANSLLLNEGGRSTDVLYDTNNGSHWVKHQIAKLHVAEVLKLSLPNENTIRRDRNGNIIYGGDLYTFEIEHKPTSCMYPHCEIVALKEGVKQAQIKNAMKTTIRAQFARLAEKARVEMTEIRARDLTQLRAELSGSS
jgi:hypothetical protein